MSALARRSRAARASMPSRALWFALGGASVVGAATLYLLFWRGLLGVPTGMNPARPQPEPSPPSS